MKFSILMLIALVLVSASAKADKEVYSLSQGWESVPDDTPTIGTMSRDDVDRLDSERRNPLERETAISSGQTLYYSVSQHTFSLSRPSDDEGQPSEDLGRLTPHQIQRLGDGHSVKVTAPSGKSTIVTPEDYKNAQDASDDEEN